MGISLTLQDRGVEAPRNAAQSTLALLGVCSGGVANEVLGFTRDTDVGGSRGNGPLTEGGGYVVRTSRVRQLLVKVNGSIAATKTSVAQSGSGPAVTLTGTPFDSLRFKLKIVLGGALGVATFRVAVDEHTLGPTLDVPAQRAAALQGSVDLTGLTLSALNTQTLKVDGDVGAVQTITFTTPTSVQDIVDQCNAGTTDMTFSLVSGRYLKVVSDTLGTGSTIQVTNGTANTNLGFVTNVSDTGEASTYEIPNTGITVTFASGTYVAGEAYTWTTTEPRFTTTDLAAALLALKNSGEEFESVWLLGQPVDGADALVLGTSLDSTVTGWQTGTPKQIVGWGMGTSLSATPGSKASDQTNDNDVKTALASFSSQIGVIAHGDVYLPGTELPGLFRRPAVWALAARHAAYRLSSDPGNGEQPALESASMVAADGSTKARDEETAFVTMRPQRFTVLRFYRGGAYFSRGVTRATPGSKFRHMGVMFMALLAARTAYAAIQKYENADREAQPDGTLIAGDADAIEQAVDAAMRSALIDSPIPGQGHASEVVIAIDRVEKVTQTNNLSVEFSVQHKAQFETITGIVGIVSTLSFQP